MAYSSFVGGTIPLILVFIRPIKSQTVEPANKSLKEDGRVCLKGDETIEI
jgi:hypothetical protein